MTNDLPQNSIITPPSEQTELGILFTPWPDTTLYNRSKLLTQLW